MSRYLCVPIAAVVIWALVLSGSYRYAERIFLFMTLVFIAYPIAAVLGHPDWHQVVHQHARGRTSSSARDSSCSA